MNGALRKAVSVFRSAAMQTRSTSVSAYVSSRPTGHVLSPAEKVAHFSIIVGTIFAYPAWVLLHLREYRGLTE
ncbi:hypothetical protein HPB48_018010 [Haemaphysalis longicornis]|uniref:Cytochrome c oxidase polypeptide viii n=1 Tax=Haemaphysalis longicornis TaxID=44386 RepID=A0A9J6F847_HAELO|nr:hypothetical protein HPB48_018010 [Haemaphysalis longicornis]